MSNPLSAIEIDSDEREQLKPIVGGFIEGAGIGDGWEEHVALVLTGVVLHVIYICGTRH